jgi:hypothetical protein
MTKYDPAAGRPCVRGRRRHVGPGAVSAIFDQLGVRSRGQAIVLAREAGFGRGDDCVHLPPVVDHTYSGSRSGPASIRRSSLLATRTGERIGESAMTDLPGTIALPGSAMPCTPFPSTLTIAAGSTSATQSGVALTAASIVLVKVRGKRPATGTRPAPRLARRAFPGQYRHHHRQPRAQVPCSNRGTVAHLPGASRPPARGRLSLRAVQPVPGQDHRWHSGERTRRPHPAFRSLDRTHPRLHRLSRHRPRDPDLTSSR